MLVLQESKNASHANYLINHPDTRPFMGDSDLSVFLDMSKAIDDCVFLECDGGGFFFVPMGKNEYEVHCAFLEGSRGKHAKISGQEALKTMFEKFGAEKIIARIPLDNKRTKNYAVHAGFKRGDLKEIDIQGEKQVVQEYSITKERFE